MRTRVLSSSVPLAMSLEEKGYIDNGATPLVLSTANHPYQPSGCVWVTPSQFYAFKSTMQDDVGTGGVMRPCLHIVEHNEFLAPKVYHRFYRGGSGNAYAYNITNTKIANTHALRVPPEYDLGYLAEQALAFMMPTVNSGESVINSIIELKDLKQSNPIGSIKRIWAGRQALQHLSRRKNRKRFQKELVTRFNNAALNASFGIVPFVSDVTNIHDELVGAMSKLSRLKHRAERQLQSHYRRILPDSLGGTARSGWIYATSDNTISWPSGLISDNLTNGGVRLPILLERRCRWKTRPIYHATMRYSYTLPKLGNTMEQVAYYLDLLGVRLDPSIVWNAIPFTFLVDWVVDVGGFLGTLARDNYPIEVNIRQFYHSIKYEREAEVDCTLQTDTGLDGTPRFLGLPKNPTAPVYRGSYRYYYRTSAHPSVTSVRTKLPSLKQAALSGSLVLSRTSWGRATGYTYSQAPRFRG